MGLIKMMKLDDVYQKDKDRWVSRLIADELVIMPLCTSEDDIQYIYSISNATGTRIFALLDGSHSVKDIQEVIKREFKGNAEVVEREVSEFLKDLLSVKVIEKSVCRKSSSIEHRETRNDARPAGKKKSYKTPEITRVKMQPEQAVLSCCLNVYVPKQRTRTPFINACAVDSSCIGTSCTGGLGYTGNTSALSS